jgi:hypothetical protein
VIFDVRKCRIQLLLAQPGGCDRVRLVGLRRRVEEVDRTHDALVMWRPGSFVVVAREDDDESARWTSEFAVSVGERLRCSSPARLSTMWIRSYDREVVARDRGDSLRVRVRDWQEMERSDVGLRRRACAGLLAELLAGIAASFPVMTLLVNTLTRLLYGRADACSRCTAWTST